MFHVQAVLDFQELSNTYQQCEVELDRLGQLARAASSPVRLLPLPVRGIAPYWLQRKVRQKECSPLSCAIPPDAPDEYRRNC